MTDAETLYFLGNRRMAAGDDAGAEACFREAVRLDADLPEAWCNLGLVLEKRGALDEAENCFRRALGPDPNYPEIHNNLAGLLARRKRFAEAEHAYRRAIALNPQSPVGWSNLGVLYASCQREDEAEQCYRQALQLDGQHRPARFNLSYLLLRQARFDEGWACLEARDWHGSQERHYGCPRWQGETLRGKSLLIGYEAGHGDMLQFCRYAPVLKAAGAAHISIICHPALKRLFGSLDGVDTIYALDEPVPASGWDYWTLPFSIPYHCKTRIDSIPAALPYLRAYPADIESQKQRLPANGMRVGLVWKGNSRFENDRDRSIPALDILAPLGKVSGVSFVSLQKGDGEDEAANPPAGLTLFDAGRYLNDFAETAAVVENLDLVISVDTAVVHLCGALGKSCWVLLPAYKADWRWLSGRTDSPWYPGVMRLFRQSEAGNWTPVIAEIVIALDQFSAQRRPA